MKTFIEQLMSNYDTIKLTKSAATGEITATCGDEAIIVPVHSVAQFEGWFCPAGRGCDSYQITIQAHWVTVQQWRKDDGRAVDLSELEALA